VWQADGWGWRARIGLLTPHADIVPESEFRAMAPDGVSIHAARVPLGAYAPGGAMDRTIAIDHVRAFADPPWVDDAAELLAAAPIQAIVYGFTSSSYVRGPADDMALRGRLELRTRGIPVVIPCAAAAVALSALGVKRLVDRSSVVLRRVEPARCKLLSRPGIGCCPSRSRRIAIGPARH
jgi:maleate isomerase